jgi:PAS domain S-box-containing protein
MDKRIRLLLIEDSEDDVRILLRHLKRSAMEPETRIVQTAEEFLAALDDGGWDLVISDFHLPTFNGLAALRLLRARDGDLPFILVSGVLDEEAAVGAMLGGANDFVLKGSLARLVPAIERELKEAQARRKQRAHQAELRLLHSAIGQTPDAILITDPAGTILYANPAAEAVSGFTREELVGQNPRIFKSAEHEDGFYRTMWETVKQGEVWRGRIVNRRKDGRPWTAELVLGPVRDESGNLVNYLAASRDVTHERELQTQLEQSQRLETMGILTGGIAHDFNNILMPIVGHAEMGLSVTELDPKVRHHLEVILTSATRAADLVRQLLSFSRQESQAPVLLDPLPLLKESLKLLRATLPSSIAFDVELDPDRCTLRGDPTQIHQVVLNLCTNAGHAMRSTGGHLRVSLRRAELPATECAMGVLMQPGGYLVLEVQDTGPGIDSETLPKIFLPFFTTKGPGEGTGLGLSIVHGIVTGMGGGVQVESTPGLGCTFRVILPCAGTAVAPLAAKIAEVKPGKGHVLLVDDEKELGMALQAGLEQIGYRVTLCTLPSEALTLLREAPAEVDVMLTDFTMPGLTGTELAGKAWELRPGLPAILMTGYSDRVDKDVARRLGFSDFLVKPLSTSDIARSIQRILGL